MMLPSKKLLSAVLNKNVLYIYDDNSKVDYKYLPTKSDICYEGLSDTIFMLNKYELMHMMKEWAYDNGYWIDSNLGFVSIGFLGVQEAEKTFNGYDLKLNENELVNKGCEWILEQTKLGDSD